MTKMTRHSSSRGGASRGTRLTRLPTPVLLCFVYVQPSSIRSRTPHAYTCRSSISYLPPRDNSYLHHLLDRLSPSSYTFTSIHPFLVFKLLMLSLNVPQSPMFYLVIPLLFFLFLLIGCLAFSPPFYLPHFLFSDLIMTQPCNGFVVS